MLALSWPSVKRNIQQELSLEVFMLEKKILHPLSHLPSCFDHLLFRQFVLSLQSWGCPHCHLSAACFALQAWVYNQPGTCLRARHEVGVPPLDDATANPMQSILK